MSATSDAVDGMRARLAELYPELDTAAFAVVGRVLRLSAVLQQRRADHLEPFGLTPADFDVLATARRIEGDRGVNPRDVLSAILITSGGLTKRLDRLESAGLLVRDRDPGDRRATLIRLTAEGRALIDEALPSLLAMEGEVVDEVLSDRQADQVAGSLRRLLVSLED